MAGPATRTLPPVTPSVEAPAGPAARSIVRAEELVEAHRYREALTLLGEVAVPGVSAPRLALRLLFCESWARMYVGEIDAAVALLIRALGLAEHPACDDRDRSEALFRLACCRVKLAKFSNAVSLLGSALTLAPEGTVANDKLRARIFDWRSRCYQRQREWESAQHDAEQSLELAREVDEPRLVVFAEMQCSLVAERRGNPLLARYYAESACTLAGEIGDRQTQARLLNNLGGLSYLLGDSVQAVAYLKESFALALEVGNDADAAQAVSSLAQVHLRCGAPLLAEEQARHALGILGERADYRDECGNLHLLLGRALLDQSRREEAMAEFAAAEAHFEAIGSVSHLAAVWMARAETHERSGDAEDALGLYRRAAEALQDFNF
jgi:tetratricopeptide (TPR) repeat protein